MDSDAVKHTDSVLSKSKLSNNIQSRKNTMSKNASINVLRPMPASCVNRGDDGAPKTMSFGGALRLRNSSQSKRRPTRFGLHELYTSSSEYSYLGLRTKLLELPLKDELVLADCPEDIAISIATAISKHFIGEKKDDKNEEDASATDETPESDKAEKGTTLAYFAPAEIRAMVNHLKANAWDITSCLTVKKNKTTVVTKALKSIMDAAGLRDAIDIALFGRMFAGSKDLNIESAISTSHAYSTHGIDVEIDSFTALDDIPSEEGGAAHMGSKEFGSGVMSESWVLNIDTLKRNLGNFATPEIIRSIVSDVVNSILRNGVPEGNRTSMLTNTLPVYATVTVSNGTPCAMSFETPVQAGRDGGFTLNSIKAFDAELQRINSYALKVHGSEKVADTDGFHPDALAKVLEYV